MDLSLLSKTPGISGTLKNNPEDFLVEEITNDGVILELDKKIERQTDQSNFVHFILQKKEWSTSYAISAMAKKLHTSAKRFNYAGLKDKRAITTQLISAQGIDIEKIRLLNIKDIQINGAWFAKDKVRLGALLGNKFTIKVQDAVLNPETIVQKIHSELEGVFPNYFGEQRFGSISPNTHIIGEKIIRGEFESAVMTFLTDYENEHNEDARIARKELRDSQDFSAALTNYPYHLRFERTMITYLNTNPGNFIGALKSLPRHTLLLFVHAFQSFMFNRLLSDRIKEGKVEMEEGEYFSPVGNFGFPDLKNMDVDGFLTMKILGYNSNPNEREKKLLEELNITKDQFKIKEFPEVSSKGTFRTAFAPLKDFSFENDTFKFSLQSGSYATTALREFLEVRK